MPEELVVVHVQHLRRMLKCQLMINFFCCDARMAPIEFNKRCSGWLSDTDISFSFWLIILKT